MPTKGEHGSEPHASAQDAKRVTGSRPVCVNEPGKQARLHHLTVDLLRERCRALKKSAASGVDGVRWAKYGEGLEDRLPERKDRIHQGVPMGLRPTKTNEGASDRWRGINNLDRAFNRAYRAQPSRRIYIPKADGRQRPIGIAALEGKVVQQAVVTILNAIYEVDFQGFHLA